jgi:hypothetical protein
MCPFDARTSRSQRFDVDSKVHQSVASTGGDELSWTIDETDEGEELRRRVSETGERRGEFGCGGLPWDCVVRDLFGTLLSFRAPFD